MKRLAATAAAALLLMGCAAPEPTIKGVEPATTPTIPAHAEPALPECQEDMPCWECKTMGNKVCGATALERVEAWGAFRTSDIPADVLREAFRVTYMGTAMPGIDFPPSSYVTIPSSITANTVHVFMVEPAVS